MSAKVLSTFGWANNAQLIAAVAPMYLRPADVVLDPTYGKGNWWTIHRPDQLVTFNRATDGSDFRALPLEDGSVDAVAFDPPYVCPGGRKTTNESVKAMHDAFGMDEQQKVGKRGKPDPLFRRPVDLQHLINDGLTEMARVVRPARTKGGTKGGIILVRCMSYVWGGTFWPGAEETFRFATAAPFNPNGDDPLGDEPVAYSGLAAPCHGLGLQCIDRFDLVKPNGGPQPKTNRDGSPRRQQHASRNSSTLWVLRVPPPAKVPAPQLPLE